MSKFLLYILKLEGGKYYIGKTNNLNSRINDHFNSRGCEWTKKHKPLIVTEIIECKSNLEEDHWVEKYMQKYGIENVRGGSYSNITLDRSQVGVLERKMKLAKDTCYICSKPGHYMNKCPAKNKCKKCGKLIAKKYNYCYKCFKNKNYKY